MYPGTATAGAPDLIMEPADWRYLPLGDPRWATHVHRTWQSGWHRRESFWQASAPASPPATPTRPWPRRSTFRSP
ncbi:hypothetical protein ACR6C2_30120 [Streptomyces sp. INA 01156]